MTEHKDFLVVVNKEVLLLAGPLLRGKNGKRTDVEQGCRRMSKLMNRFNFLPQIFPKQTVLHSNFWRPELIAFVTWTV